MDHISTESNIADIPTRPDGLTIQDLSPSSIWETGLPWMTEDISDVISRGILTPITSLTMRSEDCPEFEDGFVLERTPDILTQGHLSFLTSAQRILRTAARATFMNYIMIPTKYAFTNFVRILAICLKFVEAFKRKWSEGCRNSQVLPPPLQFRLL